MGKSVRGKLKTNIQWIQAIPAWRQVSGAWPKTLAEKMNSAIRTFGMLCFALVAGCAGVKEAPPSVMARPVIIDPSLEGPKPDGAVAVEVPRSVAIQPDVSAAPLPSDPRKTVMTRGEAIAHEPVAGAPAPPSESQSAVKAAPAPARAPAKVAAPPAAIEQPRKSEAPPTVARKLEPPLDVAALKSRLRDTMPSASSPSSRSGTRWMTC